jgi:hypothetical protein
MGLARSLLKSGPARPKTSDPASAHRALGNQFHGTDALLQEGDVITGASQVGKDSIYGSLSSASHAYATSHPADAERWASRQANTGSKKRVSGTPYVYAVEPIGYDEPNAEHSDVEYDPNFSQEADPDYAPGLRLRSSRGWVVVRNVTKDVVGYPQSTGGSTEGDKLNI